jgi:hypothetical protein
LANETRAAGTRRKIEHSSEGGILSSISHHQLWWFSLVSGAASIIAAGYLKEPFYVGLVLPILIMLGYWLIGIQLKSKPGTKSQ